jgi:O-antigen/teichoic acid export membrane protein
LRGSAIFFLARLVPSLLAVITTAILTRWLPPTTYGLYALGLSIVFIMTTGGFEWIGLSLLRMAPTAPNPEVFFGTVIACFFGIFALLTVGAAVVLLAGGLHAYTGFILACVFAAFASAWLELKQRLQLAELRQSPYFWTSVARGIATTILVSAAAYTYRQAAPALAATGFSALLAGLIVRERRLSLRKLRFDGAVTSELLRFGFPLSISMGLATILMSVDKWMLQGLSGPRAVGLFAAAALVTQVPVQTLASCIGPSAYSMAVQAVEFRAPAAARAVLARNFVVLAAIIIPAVAGIIALSHNLAHVIVGRPYWAATVALAPWLAGGAAVASLRAFYVDFSFQLAHRTSSLIWINCIAVIANIGLDLWLIPGHGELGAAIGSFSALTLSLVVAAIMSVRAYPLTVPVLETAKILASSGVMWFVLRHIHASDGLFSLVGQIGSGCMIYFAGLLVTNVVGCRTWLIIQSPGWWRRIVPSR